MPFYFYFQLSNYLCGAPSDTNPEPGLFLRTVPLLLLSPSRLFPESLGGFLRLNGGQLLTTYIRSRILGQRGDVGLST